MSESEKSREPSASYSMGGITRMYDPSEAEHDRVRRRWMNGVFLVIVALLVVDVMWCGLNFRRAMLAFSWLIASGPMALLVRVVELRFKMATEEMRRVLGQIPKKALWRLIAYQLLWMLAVIVGPLLLALKDAPVEFGFTSVAWMLAGVWFVDFATYYRHRPERMRHLYMITATLDDVQQFKAALLAPIPALLIEAAWLTWG